MNGAQISFFGNITREPDELRYTRNNGTPYATTGVAVNTYDPQSQTSEVTYYNVTLWRRNAENLINRCRKGQRVFISGAAPREELQSPGRKQRESAMT